MLKELFGSSFAMGDYGHLLVDHATMLFRTFLSFIDFTQQGFEATHMDWHQTWALTTSHDQGGETTSSKIANLPFLF